MKGLGAGLRVVGMVAVAIGVVLAVPQGAYSKLRPIVREMMENLGSLDQVGEGIALDDYDSVQNAALDLKARAERLQKQDLTTLGLDARGDFQFDAYLKAQVKAAEAISAAALKQDGRAAYRGVQELFQNACLPCHAHFREASNLLRPSSLFMTTFLNAWQDVNRGLAINDFSLVGRGAQEIASMARVLSWDQLIEEVFDIDDPVERRDFRSLVVKVADSASRMTTAASREDKTSVVNAAGDMWTNGCISCHDRFRDAE